MDKREFLEALRDRLTGEVNASVVEDNIRYYSQYINQEVAAGKTEEEVLGMLGDPNMLARTIIDADGSKESREAYTEPNSQYENSAQGPNVHIHRVNIQLWIFGVVMILLIFALGALFLRLLPFLVIAAVVLYIIRKMKS